MSPQPPEFEAGGAPKLPRERAHFTELLLANHFKEIAAPAEGTPPEGNTTYEQLTCIGYQPQLGQLNAVVSLKQANGYSGGICSAGSQEYVKFFASTDGGATWTTLGVTSFTSRDVAGPKPLEFDVTLPVDLAQACCKKENLVLIRAILSWRVPPGGATDPVVWGNGVDAYVQVAPLTLGTLTEVLECLEIPLEPHVLSEIANPEQIVEFGPAKPLTPLQLHELYRDTDIPQHRYLLGPVAQLLADPVALGAAVDQPGLQLFPGLQGIAEIGSIVGSILDPQGNETYEQLGCIGLNPSTSALVATIDVKQSAGYSGSLCTSGSQEYVAFWADSGSGYEYVGTSSVNVHDLPSIPAGGVRYSAALPFPQALTQRRACTDGPNTVAIRAVLSWATPPSDTNPYAVPVWGGHLEATVLIPPGEPVMPGGGPDLESIGNMPIGLIDQGTGLATGQSLATFVATASPFGGVVNFSGHVINPSGGVGGTGLSYRILISTDGGVTSTPMTAPFHVETNNWITSVQTSVLQTPDSSGWVSCLENYAANTDVVGNLLGQWTTAGNGQLWVAMEARQGSTPLGPAMPTWTLIQLDNTAPSPVTVEITSGGGSCGDFQPGALIEGTYSAADNEDLRAVSIAVEMPMPGSTLTKVPTFTSLTSESGTWSLQTLPTTEPCGYTIVAQASDNTIVNSGFVGWTTEAFTGLCLRPAT